MTSKQVLSKILGLKFIASHLILHFNFFHLIAALGVNT
jgi:hypothetical protein